VTKRCCHGLANQLALQGGGQLGKALGGSSLLRRPFGVVVINRLGLGFLAHGCAPLVINTVAAPVRQAVRRVYHAGP